MYTYINIHEYTHTHTHTQTHTHRERERERERENEKISRDSVEEEMFFLLQGEHLEIVVEEEREPLSNYLAKK